MATKSPYPEAVMAEPDRVRTGTLKFRMPGLFVDAEGEATLEGAPYLSVDMAPVIRHLEKSGLDQGLIDEAVDNLAVFLQSRLLAEHFAKSAKILGFY